MMEIIILLKTIFGENDEWGYRKYLEENKFEHNLLIKKVEQGITMCFNSYPKINHDSKKLES